MRESYGFSGRILFIDLSEKASSTEPTEASLFFPGGRGVNQWLLFNLLEDGVDPLGEHNCLILGAGPMVGTPVPSGGRLAVDYKNVITGGVGSGNCGGRFAAEMKYAGYDHVVLRGKAERPTYVYIEDNRVYFRDAGEIYGRGTWETNEFIKSKEGDRRISTLTIGPAGERGVGFSCIIGDGGRAVGYGGGGAVMGSKNLKAVAVRGRHHAVRVAMPDAFMYRLRSFRREVLEKSRIVDIHRRGGTLGAYLLPGEDRPHGVRNMSEEFWSNEAIDRVKRENFDAFLTRRHACSSCPVYCSGFYQVEGMHCEGIQANSLRAFGSNVDVTDARKILYAHALCNDLGLDTDQTSASIAWAMECFERGIIDEEDTGGMELRFGDGDCVARLIGKIARREGFGDILADGVDQAARRIGRGSGELALLVKKNSAMEAGMRSHKAWALGIVTSAKGTGHLRGAPGVEFQGIPPEASQRLLGIEDISDPTSYVNKPALVVWQERYKAAVDMMGICALSSMWMDRDLFTPRQMVDFLRDLTGLDISADELMGKGEALQTLERSFNLLHAGFDRSDDMPPRKLVEIPVGAGRFRGEHLDMGRWNEMLDEYYDLHKWDRATGRPTRARLVELGLDNVAERLCEQGLI